MLITFELLSLVPRMCLGLCGRKMDKMSSMMNKSDHPCLSVCTSLGSCGRMGPVPASHPGSCLRPSMRHFHLVTSHMLPSFLVGALPLSTPEMYLVFIVSGWAASTFSAQGSLPQEKSLLVPYEATPGIQECTSMLACLCPASASWVYIPFTCPSSPFSVSTCLIPAIPPQIEAGFTVFSPPSAVQVLSQQVYITVLCLLTLGIQSAW